MVNQLVDLESPKNKDFIENNNDEKNVNNNSEKQVINNTVESVDKRMLNIEKAGRTIKILGVAMFIQFSAILIIVKSYSAVLGNADIIAFIIFIGYSVLTYITGSKIKKIISAKNWNCTVYTFIDKHSNWFYSEYYFSILSQKRLE